MTRPLALGLAVLGALAAVRAQPVVRLANLLDGDGLIALTLEAPLQDLFARGSDDENVSVPGTLAYKDPHSGEDVVLRGIAVSERGHTSRGETECTFPKLKLKLNGAGSVKIGTHCGESADGHLTPKYGRLANEKSPHREALAYEILRAADVPSLRARPARITYVDKAAQTLTRDALLLEDDDDAMKRVGGRKEVTLDDFGSVTERHASADAAPIAFGEAMIGNFDWCVKFAPDDTYRCDASKPLWNVLAFDRGASTALLMKDFDLAGVVVGRHGWFDKTWNRAFVRSGSTIDIEVLSQVQRTRSLFGRDTLDVLRKRLVERRPAVLAAIQHGVVDEEGRLLARSYVEDFYRAIATDEAFYRPVVARSDVQIYMDPDRTKEACGPKDFMKPGTPVNEIRRSGTMSQVVILDALWRWASKNECNNVQDGPVWIPSSVMTTDYPPRKNP